MEVSSSAIRHHLLAVEELVPVKFQSRMVDRYLVYLFIFMAFALALTYVALMARSIANLASPLWTQEAVEVQGFLGLILPAFTCILLVLTARYAWDRLRGETIRPVKEEKEGDKGKQGYLERFLFSTDESKAT